MEEEREEVEEGVLASIITPIESILPGQDVAVLPPLVNGSCFISRLLSYRLQMGEEGWGILVDKTGTRERGGGLEVLKVLLKPTGGLLHSGGRKLFP